MFAPHVDGVSHPVTVAAEVNRLEVLGFGMAQANLDQVAVLFSTLVRLGSIA